MAKIDSIVNKQVRIWSKELQQSAKAGQTPTFWPLITISREFGSRGAAVAAILGERTGFTIWNRELVQAIADDSKANERMMDALDERRRKVVEDAVLGALMGTKVTNLQYHRSLLRLVQTLAARGSAVVVGRGANYVLRPDQALRVRVVCPIDDRVRGYAKRQGISDKDARAMILTRDKERAEFVRHQFRREVDDAADYDMVLNSGTFELDQLAAQILLGYRQKFERSPERTRS